MPTLRAAARPPALTAILAALLIGCTAASSVAPGPSRSPVASAGGGASTSDEPSASIPGPTHPPLATGPDQLRLERVVEGLADPINIAHAADGSGRLFINEQAGAVRVIEPEGTLLEEPFVDLSARVPSGGGQGQV